MKYLLPFIIGSSIISTILSFLYIGNANSKFILKTGKKPFPFELAIIFIAILFGLFNIINVNLQKSNLTCTCNKQICTCVKNNKHSFIISFSIGGFLGLLFSSIGRFKYNLPITIFGFTKKNQNLVHVYAFILYGLIFSLIVQQINDILI